MKKQIKVLSFQRDDQSEKSLESAIRSASCQCKFIRVEDLNNYMNELMTDSFDCIVCDESSLEDYEKKNTIKLANDISPFSTFIYLSNSEKNEFISEISKRYKNVNFISRKNLSDISVKNNEFRHIFEESKCISNYWG